MNEKIPQSSERPELVTVEKPVNKQEAISERTDKLVDDEIKIIEGLTPATTKAIEERRGSILKKMILGTIMAAMLAGASAPVEAGQFGGLGKLASKVGSVVKDKADAVRDRVQKKGEKDQESGSYIELKGVLTDAEVEAAIAKGKTEKPEDVGAHIIPSMSADWIGEKIAIYTPGKWIELLSAEAKEEYRKITLKEVTKEMRAPVLHIIVPKGGVQRLILLAPNSKEDGVHASKVSDAEIATMPTGFGLRESASGGRAQDFQFPMADVETIRKAGDGTFDIMAQGTGTSMMGVIMGREGGEKKDKRIGVEHRHLKGLYE